MGSQHLGDQPPTVDFRQHQPADLQGVVAHVHMPMAATSERPGLVGASQPKPFNLAETTGEHLDGLRTVVRAELRGELGLRQHGHMVTRTIAVTGTQRRQERLPGLLNRREPSGFPPNHAEDPNRRATKDEANYRQTSDNPPVDSLDAPHWRLPFPARRPSLAAPLTLDHLHNPLPSEGLVAGAIQIPPSGQPVIFLADHPVTGGYPVLGVVRARSLPLLAQARPGQRLRLRVT
ncbi:Allophanate hydrolase subunit 2 [Micromonospora viridifaciens]|uniref:Allophanate hydrolase subunit 2 n=1 Tax=Micromonospora viridifaciens TaxID=1881 RepID=A0A1C4YDI3_MICVI|nr:Allophanate hydrolase subunit 2 [Micromonospora viridifaciens]